MNMSFATLIRNKLWTMDRSPDMANKLLNHFKDGLKQQTTFCEETTNTLIAMIDAFRNRDLSIEEPYNVLNNIFRKYDVQQLKDHTLLSTYLYTCSKYYKNDRKVVQKVVESLDLERIEADGQLMALEGLAGLQYLSAQDHIDTLIELIRPKVDDTNLTAYLKSIILLCPDEDRLRTLVSEQEHLIGDGLSKRDLYSCRLIINKLLNIPNKDENLEGVLPRPPKERSLLQMDIEAILRMNGVKYEAEKLIQHYYADIFIPVGNILLEVNGPYHTVYDGELYSGKHVLKQKVFKSLGYDTRNLQSQDYYKTKGVAQRSQFVIKTIQ